MRRVREHSSRYTAPVRLFWDDLEQIAEVVSTGEGVTVKSGEFEYDSLDELKASCARSALTNLELRARNGALREDTITVSIEPQGASVFMNPEAHQRGARAVELLRNAVPWYSWKGTTSAWHGIAGGLEFLLFMIGSGLVVTAAESWQSRLALYVVGMPLLWVLTMRGAPLIGATKIYTARRSEHQSFWDRNRDALLVNLLVAIISIVLGIVVGRVWD